jgi:hypothetical protein
MVFGETGHGDSTSAIYAAMAFPKNSMLREESDVDLHNRYLLQVIQPTCYY